MNIAKAVLICLCAAATGALAVDYVEVTSVKARQRYPWNGLVDIDFTLDSIPTEPYQMQVEAFDNVGKTNLPVKTVYAEGISFKQNPCMVAIGTRRIIWDAGADLPNGFKCENVLVTCRDTRIIYDPTRYMIIDMSGGTNAVEFPVTYVSAPPRGGWTDEYKSKKMVLRRIDPGKFMSGYSLDEPNLPPAMVRSEFEYKEAEITNSFYVGVFPLTYLQTANFVDFNKYSITRVEKDGLGPSLSSVNMTVDDCTVLRGYAPLKGVATLKSSPYDKEFGSIFQLLGSKLPNMDTRPLDSIEWQYVCRGGCARPFYTGVGFGETNDILRCVYNEKNMRGVLPNFGRYKVGSYMPNAPGIYDLGMKDYEYGEMVIDSSANWNYACNNH